MYLGWFPALPLVWNFLVLGCSVPTACGLLWPSPNPFIPSAPLPHQNKTKNNLIAWPTSGLPETMTCPLPWQAWRGRVPHAVTKAVIQASSLSLDFLRTHSALLSFAVVWYKYSKFPDCFKGLQMRAYEFILFKLGIGKQLPSSCLSFKRGCTSQQANSSLPRRGGGDIYRYICNYVMDIHYILSQKQRALLLFPFIPLIELGK